MKIDNTLETTDLSRNYKMKVFITRLNTFLIKKNVDKMKVHRKIVSSAFICWSSILYENLIFEIDNPLVRAPSPYIL